MADSPRPVTVRVERELDVVICQQKARAFAAEIGFDLRAQWEIAIAVSEAATNIRKYAGAGWVSFRPLEGEPPGLEFEALDEGRGIGDLEAALQDGISQGRSALADGDVSRRRGLGLGLGTIRRLMGSLEIESVDGRTAVRAARRLPPRTRA
jgi:anti-sigma regulatory factor (Ser/Thr protein kinase)